MKGGIREGAGRKKKTTVKKLGSQDIDIPKITIDENEVIVITPDSPIGRDLLGKEVGDLIEIRVESSLIEYELIENSPTKLEITDIYGRNRNITIEQSKGLHKASVSTLSAGVYIVSLRASGVMLVSKVVVW